MNCNRINELLKYIPNISYHKIYELLKYSPDMSNLMVQVEVKFNHYNNGNLSCMLWDVSHNEPFCVVTKNIHSLEFKKKAYVDLNNGGQALICFLEENDIARNTGFYIFQGYCYYPLYEFNINKANKKFYYIS